MTCAIAAVLLAGCGGGDDGAGKAASGDAMKQDTAMKPKAAAGGAMHETAMASKEAATVRVISSQFGAILGDRRGQAFYRFAKEKTRTSECYGACAKTWPPVLTKRRPVAGKGARTSLLGTTRRRDGALQVTYKGRPLYYFVKDAPGKVLCNGVSEFGGRWLVLSATA
jgi:predicted lipoprotein with Yx(FWY)xxD motif